MEGKAQHSEQRGGCRASCTPELGGVGLGIFSQTGEKGRSKASPRGWLISSLGLCQLNW